MFGHTIGGNENGHTAVHEGFLLMRQHLPLKRLMVISDRGTFSATHTVRMHQEGFQVLCSAPWDQYQKLFDAHRDSLQWSPASYLSIEQQRRRTACSLLPHEHYELAEIKHELVVSAKGAQKEERLSCRVIFVRSTADEKVSRRVKDKTVAKISQGLQTLAQRVQEGTHRTSPQAIAERIAKLMSNHAVAKHFHWEMIPLSAAERAALPKPGRGRRLADHRLVFHYDAQAAAAEKTYDGLSVLVTTASPEQTTDALFTTFRKQTYSEQVNHQWKTPLAVHPVFLQNPQRVEALLFLMIIALMAYHLLQRGYRQATPETAPVQERRMTTERILRTFSTYCLIRRRHPAGHVIRATRLTALQNSILQKLGFDTPQQLLQSMLRPPPEI